MFEITCFDSDGNSINYFTQWDVGQKIFVDIKGYSSKYDIDTAEVHFANKNSEAAEVVRASVSNDILSANVPDQLLQEHLPLLVYIYLIDVDDNDSQKTVLQTKIPIRERSKPFDYDADDSGDYATANDILKGKMATVNGITVTGSIPSLGAQTITPKTSDQTIGARQYLSGTQTIKGDAKLIPSNIKKNVEIFGVTGTLETNTNPLVSLQANKTVTPTASEQKIYPDNGYDGFEMVTIATDPDLIPSNIIRGKNIFGVNGNHECTGSNVDWSRASVVAEDMVSGVTAYGAGGTLVTGNVNTSTSNAYFNNGDIIHDEGLYIRANVEEDILLRAGSKANIHFIVDSDNNAKILGNATSSDVLSGRTFTSANGITVTGTHDCSGGSSGGGVDLKQATSDATATASDIADGMTAYVNGEKITGNIKTRSGYVHFYNGEIVDDEGLFVKINIEEDILLRTGSKVCNHFYTDSAGNADLLGNATASDVLSGKTFTSANGMTVAGTHVCSGGGSGGSSTGMSAKIVTDVQIMSTSNYIVSFSCADEISAINGEINLVNATEINNAGTIQIKDAIPEKFIKNSNGNVFYIPSDAVLTSQGVIPSTTLYKVDKAIQFSPIS